MLVKFKNRLNNLKNKLTIRYLKTKQFIYDVKMFARWILDLGKLEGFSISWNKNKPQRRALQFKAVYYSECDQFYIFNIWWFTFVFAPEHYVWNELFDYKTALAEIIRENPALHAFSPNRLVRQKAENFIRLDATRKQMEQNRSK